MVLIKRGINALRLLNALDLREFRIRLKIFLGQIDLGNVTTEELRLSPERSSYYSNSGGAQLDNVLKSFDIGPKDAVVDFGCGKGGALITLAKYPFSGITGVEISEELVAIARDNLRKLGIGNVEMTVCDATQFVDLDDFTYVYFFNPFPCNVMSAVIGNLTKSLARVPRTMTIIYLNPACHETIVRESPFVKVAEFPHHLHEYFIYSNTPEKNVESVR